MIAYTERISGNELVGYMRLKGTESDDSTSVLSYIVKSEYKYDSQLTFSQNGDSCFLCFKDRDGKSKAFAFS